MAHRIFELFKVLEKFGPVRMRIFSDRFIVKFVSQRRGHMAIAVLQNFVSI